MTHNHLPTLMPASAPESLKAATTALSHGGGYQTAYHSASQHAPIFKVALTVLLIKHSLVKTLSKGQSHGATV